MNVSVSEICYKKNYLTEAVAAVQFASPPQGLIGPVLDPGIQSAVRARYKIYEPNVATQQHVEFTQDGVNTKKTKFHNWTYHGEAREKTITLNRNQLTVSNRDYKSFAEFKSDFTQPLNELIRVDAQIPVMRTGVRFVNVFTGLASNEEQLSEYFQPMISSSFANIVDRDLCVRQVQVCEYLKENFKMRVQSGVFNSDYPARIKKWDFVLDFDCYVDTPHILSEVPASIDLLHEAIQRKFEALVTDKLRGVMNG